MKNSHVLEGASITPVTFDKIRPTDKFTVSVSDQGTGGAFSGATVEVCYQAQGEWHVFKSGKGGAFTESDERGFTNGGDSSNILVRVASAAAGTKLTVVVNRIPH